MSDLVEEVGEEFDPAGLVVGDGVVALAEHDGLERGVGGEVDAGLADRLEAAVELGGSLAPSVAEQSVVDLVAHALHVGSDGVGGDGSVGGVERFDLGGDGGVFVGDNPVGDLGVAAGHVQGAVPEQGGNDIDGHAAVDGLGRERVPEPVGVDVGGEPGASSDALDPAVDGVAVQWSAARSGRCGVCRPGSAARLRCA